MGIEIKNLSFKYKDSDKYIFNDLNLNINKRINFILGESGCGKTTLINLILQFLDKESGQFLINNQEINFKNLFSYIFYLPCDGNLIENITVKDNLMLINNQKEEIDNLLKYFNLSHLLNSPISNLSKGEQKKLSLISAFLCKQEYVIFDEPIQNIDIESEKLFYDLIKKYSNNHIFIIATHEPYPINIDHDEFNIEELGYEQTK